MTIKIGFCEFSTMDWHTHSIAPIVSGEHKYRDTPHMHVNYCVVIVVVGRSATPSLSHSILFYSILSTRVAFNGIPMQEAKRRRVFGIYAKENEITRDDTTTHNPNSGFYFRCTTPKRNRRLVL